MQSSVDIKQIEQKAFRDSQQDGLMELVMGICLLLMSTRLFSRVLIGMFPVAMILFAPVLNTMRKRFTYPRIGYVKLVPDKPKDAIAGIVLITLIIVAVMAVAFILFANVWDFTLWLKWIPLWAGVVLAIMFVSLVEKSGNKKYYLFALWSVVYGLVMAILKFEPVETGVLLYFLAMGALLTPCGLILFMRFLKKYPKPEEVVSNGNQ
jgi:hypothetical protein